MENLWNNIVLLRARLMIMSIVSSIGTFTFRAYKCLFMAIHLAVLKWAIIFILRLQKRKPFWIWPKKYWMWRITSKLFNFSIPCPTRQTNVGGLANNNRLSTRCGGMLEVMEYNEKWWYCMMARCVLTPQCVCPLRRIRKLVNVLTCYERVMCPFIFVSPTSNCWFETVIL